MDCVGRTYNIYETAKKTGLLERNLASYLHADWQYIYNCYGITKEDKKRQLEFVQSGFTKLNEAKDCFRDFDFLKPYFLKEINDCCEKFKDKPRAEKKYEVLCKFKAFIENFEKLQNKTFDDAELNILNLLYETAEHEATKSDGELDEIDKIKKEIEDYQREFEKEISEKPEYDFIKNVFLCEIEHINLLINNFDKVRPEWLIGSWGNLSLNILTYCHDNKMLLDASGRFNACIFNFLKTYVTPIAFEKLIENAPNMFKLLGT
ncbi:MAG: hypothetical protein IJT14_00835 [Rickettsiales bacterium]|nr:hypothetical protein [Rickettsiales bacterium]